MRLRKIRYDKLNGKQQEIYNFHKVAAALADYGFNCIKLADDWQGADFLAYHKDGRNTLKVQLKGRLTIGKKYLGKGIYLAFPVQHHWYLVPHNDLVRHLRRSTTYLTSRSWRERGGYSSGRPSKRTSQWLERFRL